MGTQINSGSLLVFYFQLYPSFKTLFTWTTILKGEIKKKKSSQHDDTRVFLSEVIRQNLVFSA